MRGGETRQAREHEREYGNENESVDLPWAALALCYACYYLLHVRALVVLSGDGDDGS